MESNRYEKQSGLKNSAVWQQSHATIIITTTVANNVTMQLCLYASCATAAWTVEDADDNMSRSCCCAGGQFSRFGAVKATLPAHLAAALACTAHCWHISRLFTDSCTHGYMHATLVLLGSSFKVPLQHHNAKLAPSFRLWSLFLLLLL